VPRGCTDLDAVAETRRKLVGQPLHARARLEEHRSCLGLARATDRGLRAAKQRALCRLPRQQLRERRADRELVDVTGV